jgi:Ribbon-helix-helix protein, copG family
MHRTQIMLDDQQYERLKLESRLTGRSIADLIREAVDARLKADRDRGWNALLASYGAWADRDDIGSGAEYVERIREPLEGRLRELGWG